MSELEKVDEWNDYIRHVGDSMHRIREKKGLSQEQVAYRAGISRYTYQRLEKGPDTAGPSANPTLKIVKAIADALEEPIGKIVDNRFYRVD